MAIGTTRELPPRDLTIADVCAETGLTSEVVDLLHLLFSRLLGHYRNTRSPVHQLALVVAQLCRLAYEDGDRMVDAPYPALQDGWPTAKSTFGRLKPLGITPDALTEMWDEAEAVSLRRPTMPLWLVVAFFPLRLWAPMATLIAWGPHELQRRMQMYERQERVRKVKPTRARPNGGKVAPTTVSMRLGLLRGLMKQLNGMSADAIETSLLDEWKALPSAPRASGNQPEERQVTDRSGPPLWLCRRALRRIDADISGRLRTKRRRENLLRLYRKRLWLALLLCHGTRKRALAELTVGSYILDYPFLDGVRRPVICVDPRKTLPPGAYRYKVLPPQIEEWLLVYLDYVGYAALDRHADGTIRRGADGRVARCRILAAPETPLWVAKFERKPDGTRVALPVELPESAIGNAVAGVSSKDKRKRMLPLIPHPRATSETHGYSTHALRHATHHLAARVGFDIKETEPDRFGHWQPVDFARALLDHALPNPYADQRGPNRELAACLAALGVWELLWEDRGARQVPDRARQAAAAAALAAARAEHELAARRVEELDSEREHLLARDLPAVDADVLDRGELIRAQTELLAAMAEAWTRLARLDHALARANRAVVDATRALVLAEAEQAAARAATVPADDLDDAEPLDDVTDASTADAPAATAEPEFARGYVLCAEAAEAFEVPESTMRRWFQGKLPHNYAPWDPAAHGGLPDVIEQISPRVRRLWIIPDDPDRAVLDPTRVPASILERLYELMRSP